MISNILPETSQEMRHTVYNGTVIKIADSVIGKNLAAEVSEIIVKELGEPIREAQFRLTEEQFFQQIGKLRKKFYSEDYFHDKLRQIINHYGFSDREHAFDPMRLRVVAHEGYKNPSAAPVYYGHRDTWYGNPQNQITWWLALHNVEEQDTFVFYPDYFHKAVANDSECFDYDSWTSKSKDLKIGWQNSNSGREALYPQLREDPKSFTRVSFSANKGDILVFAGQHLHQTLKNNTGLTRFSIDFRTVHLEDHEKKIGIHNVDNRSTGSALKGHIWPQEMS